MLTQSHKSLRRYFERTNIHSLIEITHSDIHANDRSSRKLMEEKIAGEFETCYGAQVSHFLPHLLDFRCNDRSLCLVGVNPVKAEAVFLEQYLGETLEQAVASKLMKPVLRSQLVEIGNLVSMHPGASLSVFLILAKILYQAGFEHMVFTATAQVKHIISKTGLEVITLAEADPSRLSDGGKSWGTYYDTKPMVLVASLKNAKSILESIYEYSEFTKSLDLDIDNISKLIR